MSMVFVSNVNNTMKQSFFEVFPNETDFLLKTLTI